MFGKRYKIILLVVSILISFTGFSQNMRNLIKDADLNQIIVHYTDSLAEAHYYKGGKKIKLNPERMYFWYSAKEIKHTRGSYDGLLLHGEYAAFYYNKDLLGKGYFKYGLKHGVFSGWYSGGEIKFREHWKKGLRTGESVYYAPNGSVRSRVSYRKGLKVGSEIIYDEQGNVLEKRKYKKGKLVLLKEKKRKKTKEVKVKGKGKNKIKGKRSKTLTPDTEQIAPADPSKKAKTPKAPKEKKKKKKGIEIYKYKQILPGGQGA